MNYNKNIMQQLIAGTVMLAVIVQCAPAVAWAGESVPAAPETVADLTEEPETADSFFEDFFGGEAPADEEEEPIPEAVMDEEGRYQIWDTGEAVYAWIPVPSGMTVDEEWTNLYALTVDSEDPDTLNAEAEYYVYNAEEGYQDFNMDDPLEIEAAYLEGDEELSYNGPSEIETFTVDGMEYLGASLQVAYLPEDGAPVYTTEYLVWVHQDEKTIVTCLIHLMSANPEPGLTMEDAAGLFLR